MSLPTEPKKSLFAKIGPQVLRSRRLIFGIWAMIMVLSLILTPQLERSLKGAGMTYEGGEAQRTERLLQQTLKFPADPLTLVFQATSNQPLTQIQSEIDRLLTQIRQLPEVNASSQTESPTFQSSNGRTQYTTLNLKPQGSDAVPTINTIEQRLKAEGSPNLKVFVTGKAVVDRDAQIISKADLSRAEFVALPLTLVALLFVFGSIVAAPLPLAMAILTITTTFGVLYWIAQQMQMSVLALNFTSMLGLGLGIDYSLVIVNRFREELDQHSGDVSLAVVRTIETAGQAVFVSGLTDCISLVCLLFFPISLLRSIGIAGCLAVVISVIVALTLLPVILSLIGTRINWGRRVIQPFARQTRGFWAAIGQTVMRYSIPIVAIILVIVFGLFSPFFRVNFGLGDASILPRSVPSREGVEVIQAAFGPGEISPILLTIQTTNPGDSTLSRHHLAALDPVIRQLSADPRVAKVRSLLNLDPRFTLRDYQNLYQQPIASLPSPIAATVSGLSNDSTQLIVIWSQTSSHDRASHELVKELRSLSFDGLTIQVGGATANEMDTLQAVSQRFPYVLIGIMVVTFIVLCLLFDSVVLSLKAIVMNFLSIGASFGSLVFVFQEGHLQRWLNFTPLGYLDIMLPLVLFCVVFGLSMDYEVFLLSRIKEAHETCGNNSKSVIIGLEQTGGMITSAASLMIIVTGAFMLTNIIFMKALGLGIALAVLIDSTLIRIFFVPATMHLMGRWNWWMPGWVRRLNPFTASQ